MQRLTIAPNQISHHSITLTPEQQHYLTRVLRLGTGDRFIAMDGLGHWWLAELQAQPDQATLLEAVTVDQELPVPVILLVAMPKGNGMDEVVRQVTELGVGTVVPVISERTLLQPNPTRLERWRRIAQEAAEQSERQRVPEIHDPQPLRIALKDWQSQQSACYFCAERGNNLPLLRGVLNPVAPGALSQLVLVTGPEGGWTGAEVEGAIALGYQPVSLGRRILRAVTAPVAAVAIVAAAIEFQGAP